MPGGRPSVSQGLEGGNRAGIEPGGSFGCLGRFCSFRTVPPQPFYLQVSQRTDGGSLGRVGEEPRTFSFYLPASGSSCLGQEGRDANPFMNWPGHSTKSS